MQAKTSAKFEELYRKLNPEQKEAVDTIEGPVMVVAGPGTGKTTILTLRIANILLKTDTPPSGILAITFTDAGAKAMRQKLREIIGNTAHEVRISTFHGFAASVIAEFKDHFVHLDGTKQMTDIEAENLLRKILENEKYAALRPYGNPDFYLGKILSGISDAKRDALTPEMVRSYVKSERDKIEQDEASYSTRGATKGKLKGEALKLIEKCERTLVFADVYETYEATKRKEKLMDFDDLIVEVLLSFRTDKLLLQILQERFLYILIDEHQDTNDAQNELVRLLADFFDTPNVFIVGDEKQAIYRFQGASVDNFLKFEHAWRNMKVIGLESNYRSHESILNASFSMIEQNYEEGEHANLRIKLRSGAPHEARPIDIVAGEDTAGTESYLVKELQRVRNSDAGATIAIITKTNRDLERVLAVCARNDIPVSSERSIDIFKHPLGSLFFDLAEFLHDPTRHDLFARTLIAGLWGLTFEESVELIKTLRSGKKADLSQVAPVLGDIYKELTAEGGMGFLMHLAQKTGFLDYVVRDPDAVEVWRGITTLSESLVREAGGLEPRELLRRLVAYRASSESRSVKVSVGAPDLPVRALTAHASKGLEFDYVFVPYATEESWIGRTQGTYFILPERRAAGDVKDVRRLFYVALTRAKKHATILFGKEENGKETLTPLRFIDELDKEHVAYVELARNPREVKDLVAQKYGTKDFEQKVTDYAKRTLLNSGLSVTALNHFLTCPSAFLYQSILKLPQAPAASAEKGNAMHQAFARVWSSKAKHASTIEQLIKETIEAYFETSLLPLFEKETVKKELVEHAPVVARALESHFNQEGSVFSETWSESTLVIQVDDEDITVPIHGKLDAIVDQEKTTWVYDYKTREAMSENEIKGETKNSDGNYFRQLVFYRLLIENDSRFTHKSIMPALVFVRPDRKGNCPVITLPIEAKDLVSVKDDIQSLVEAVWSSRFVTEFCEDPKCEWCRLKKISVN